MRPYSHLGARISDGSSLIASGLNDAQAAAVVEVVEATVHSKVELLRHDLARWQLYLALLLLTQFGLFLVAAMLTSPLPLPGH